jgi:hypothetical protein
MAMNIKMMGESTTEVVTAPDGNTRPALVPIQVTNGAGLVAPVYGGTGEINKNRNINAAVTTYAAATNTATWTSTDNVKSIVITPKSATAAALQNDEFCLVVFDATNEAVASGFLSDTGGASTDVEYFMVAVGQKRQFDFVDYLTRVDVLPLNDTMRVVIEAN